MTAPVVILAGGVATRLRPLTEKIPKSLVVVAGRPFVEHQLRLLRGNGVERVVICAGYKGEMLQEFVGDGSRFGLRAEFIFDGESPLGTGGAVKKAVALAGDIFFVMYGDSYLTESFAPVEAYFRKSDKPALMTVYKNEGRYDCANMVLADGRIVRYDKKNKTPDMLWIDYGLCMLRREVFSSDGLGDKFDLSELLGPMVKVGQVLGWQVQERFYEIGSFKGLEETSAYLARKGG